MHHPDMKQRPVEDVPLPSSDALTVADGSEAVAIDSGRMLHVKEKEGVYLRLMLVRQNENIFQERYCGWDVWAALRNELDSLRGDINSLIKNSRTDQAVERTLLLRNVLLKLLQKTGLDDALDNISGLDVFYGKGTSLLPFEALSDKIFVRTFIPAKRRQKAVPGEGMTMVYSPELDHARREVAGIVAAVRNRPELGLVELYSDRLYDLHRAGPRSDRIFHFAGHGTVSDGKGGIHIGNDRLEAVLYRQETELAFLNCCHVGSVADGIVSSLLNEGVRQVIASPYEIPDTQTENGINQPLAEFYRDLDTDDIALSWRLFCLKNPYFGRFFRLFGSY